ncbi:MAG: hypothetical protein C9356_20040 [Oleiphilus sp.]|nr:MAG: hypothetical protein C9356_20040 [Oleiphilus sp.]
MKPSRLSDSIEFPKDIVTDFNHILFLRNFFQNREMYRDEFNQIESQITQQMPVLEDDVEEVECYAPEEISTNKLNSIFKTDIRPVVIRGFAKDYECVKRWNPDFFKENYGDFKIFYTTPEKIMNDHGLSLGAFIDDILAGNKSRAYIETLSDIFNEYPELHDHLGIEKLDKLLGGYASYLRVAQLFFGGVGTGASFHCANELNCFLNIYGKKHWTFVHPKYSLAMYPTLINQGYFIGSFVKNKAPKRFIEQHFPLYNRIPKLTVTLEPGDLLINPPWWWHTISNITESTIAVATRWGIKQEYTRQASVLDFIQSMRTKRWSSFEDDYLKGVTVVPDAEIRKNHVSYEQMGWVAK